MFEDFVQMVPNMENPCREKSLKTNIISRGNHFDEGTFQAVNLKEKLNIGGVALALLV